MLEWIQYAASCRFLLVEMKTRRYVLYKINITYYLALHPCLIDLMLWDAIQERFTARDDTLHDVLDGENYRKLSVPDGLNSFRTTILPTSHS